MNNLNHYYVQWISHHIQMHIEAERHAIGFEDQAQLKMKYDRPEADRLKLEADDMRLGMKKHIVMAWAFLDQVKGSVA